MSSRRSTPSTLWLAVQFLCLAALFSLSPASGQPYGKASVAAASPEPQKLAVTSNPAPEPEPARAEPSAVQPGRKIRVLDAQVGQFLADAGNRLLGDYGGFRVFEVDETTAAALAGKARRRDPRRLRSDHAEHGPDQHGGSLRGRPADVGGTFPGKRLHLVQFAAPVQPAWLDAIEKTGVQVVTYVPANAYLRLRGGGEHRPAAVDGKGGPFIQWDGAYLDNYKIHPRARETDEKGAARAIGTDYFAIQMVDDPVRTPRRLR